MSTRSALAPRLTRLQTVLRLWANILVEDLEMKVLFVCHGNVGRCQVGQVYFDRLSQHESSCAGTAVDEALARQGICDVDVAVCPMLWEFQSNSRAVNRFG